MDIILILNSAIALAISALLIWGYIRRVRCDQIHKAANLLTLNSLTYLILAVFFFLWALGILDYNLRDLTLIYALVILIQTILFLKITKNMNSKTNLKYLLSLYLLTLLSVYGSFLDFSLILLLVSFILSLILSTSLLPVSLSYRNVGKIGSIYSTLAVIFIFLVLLEISNIKLSALAINLAFIPFVYFFLRDVEDYPKKIKTSSLPNQSKAYEFIQNLVFVIVIINFVLLSTIGVHEFGHVVAASVYDCDSKIILYEQGSYPHTEILCNDSSGRVPISLAGPAIPLILALILFFLGGNFIKSISLLVAGFSFLSSYKDLTDLGFSQNIMIVIILAGLMSLIIGLIMLIKYRVKHPNDFHHEYVS